MQGSPTSAALRPFVKQLWVSSSRGSATVVREHVLPTGLMHLVFRLSGPPLRVFRDADDMLGQSIAEPVVGGARSSFYAKEIGAPVVCVGAQLLPGASQALFGVSAAELAERHTPLSELWGASAFDALDRIRDAQSSRQQLVLLENILAARLRDARALHPAVADALGNLNRMRYVRDVVQTSRYSHRGFVALFRQAAGLAPKRYARLMRFQSLVAANRAALQPDLTDLALSTGYSDQAHMNREFREFAGVTPLLYRKLSPRAPHHVELPGT